MAAHSSVLAWRIPWTEEPAGLQFIAGVQPWLIQGIRSRDGGSEDQDTIASIRY